MAHLAKLAGVRPTARHVIFESAHGYTTNVPLAEALLPNVLVAHHLSGDPLPTGPKPFVDDGNSFWGIRQIPAITHGPRAGGQHTVKEWVDVPKFLDGCRMALAVATLPA